MEELYQAKIRLEEQVVNNRTATLAHLAHDIGTPLSAMVLASQAIEGILQRAPPELAAESVPPQDAMGASLGAIRILRKTIMDYVNNNDIVGEAQSLEPVHVKSTVEKMVMPILRQMLGAHGTSRPSALLDIDPTVADLTVLADPAWMVDMILNFVGNATKFTRHGHVKLIVAVWGEGVPPLKDGVGDVPADAARQAHSRSKEEIVFAVEDTGIGLDPLDAARLFRPFAQVNKSRALFIYILMRPTGLDPLDAARLFRPFAQVKGTIGGTGLGLTSVLRKAERLKGSAGVIPRNSEGGCTFWFSQPLKRLESGKSRKLRPSLQGGRKPKASSSAPVSKPKQKPERQAVEVEAGHSSLRLQLRPKHSGSGDSHFGEGATPRGSGWMPLGSPPGGTPTFAEGGALHRVQSKISTCSSGIPAVARADFRLLLVDDSHIITFLTTRQV